MSTHKVSSVLLIVLLQISAAGGIKVNMGPIGPEADPLPARRHVFTRERMMEFMNALPGDIDPIVFAVHPDTPYEHVPDYFKREQFRPCQSVIDRHIGDPFLLGTEPFYSGPALPDIDPTLHRSPFRNGFCAIHVKDSPFLTRTGVNARAAELAPLRNSDDILFNPPGANLLGRDMFADDSFTMKTEPIQSYLSPFRSYLYGEEEEEDGEKVERVPISTARMMRNEIDEMIVNPEDASLNPAALEEDEEEEQTFAGIRQAKVGVGLSGGEKMSDSMLDHGFQRKDPGIPIRVANDPSTMHLKRAEKLAKANPRADSSMLPLVTGGISIGFRCKDGVVLASDTMLLQGSHKAHIDMRRLHKVNDNIVISVDGEYASFQELQFIMAELVEERSRLDPPDTHRILPQEAFHFLETFMYNRRCKMQPFWNTILIGAYDVPSGFEHPPWMAHTRKPEPFLGFVDMHGTTMEDHILATGIGNYFALPLMRAVTEEVENLRENKFPKVLTVEEAVEAAKDVMRVLSLRVNTCSDRIQIAKVTEDGVEISAPFTVTSRWDFTWMHRGELGEVNNPNANPGDLCPY